MDAGAKRKQGAEARAPATPTAERLEYVRKKLGYRSMREFHAALIADGDYEVSYAAVRNYHFGRVGKRDREPPADYFVRVSEISGYELRWLITGEGPRIRTEAELEAMRRQERDHDNLVASLKSILNALGVDPEELRDVRLD